MDRDDRDVARSPLHRNPGGDLGRRGRREIRQDIHTRPLARRSPVLGHAAGARGNGDDDDPPPRRKVDDRRPARLAEIPPGPRRLEACAPERLERLERLRQSFVPEVKDVVVGEHAGVDSGSV